MNSNETEELSLEEIAQDVTTDGESYFTISFWSELSKAEL
jgi:hypothetical protein